VKVAHLRITIGKQKASEVGLIVEKVSAKAQVLKVKKETFFQSK
jgi:hypothetical protein